MIQQKPQPKQMQMVYENLQHQPESGHECECERESHDGNGIRQRYRSSKSQHHHFNQIITVIIIVMMMLLGCCTKGMYINVNVCNIKYFEPWQNYIWLL